MEEKDQATRFEVLNPGDQFYFPPEFGDLYMKIVPEEFVCERSKYSINAICLRSYRACFISDGIRGIVKKGK